MPRFATDPEFATPEQVLPGEVGTLLLDDTFMARELRLDFHALNARAGEREIAISELQPIQDTVRGPHLAALGRQHVPVNPILAIAYPDMQGRLLVAEGHHRTYLSDYLGHVALPAAVITSEEQYAALSRQEDNRSLIVNGGSMAGFRRMYEDMYKQRVQGAGITHISQLYVEVLADQPAELGLRWPA